MTERGKVRRWTLLPGSPHIANGPDFRSETEVWEAAPLRALLREWGDECAGRMVELEEGAAAFGELLQARANLLARLTEVGLDLQEGSE